MRVLVFIGYLFFLLLGGGQNFYASSSRSHAVTTSAAPKLALKHAVNYTNNYENNVLIEDTDFDLEEEHSIGEEVHDKTQHKSLSTLDLGPFNFCYAIIGLSKVHHCKNAVVLAQPTPSSSAPIYIENNVLLI